MLSIVAPADELLAASEHSGAPPCVWVGACAVDAATGQMLLGQWLDDELRSQVGAGGMASRTALQHRGSIWVWGCGLVLLHRNAVALRGLGAPASHEPPHRGGEQGMVALGRLPKGPCTLYPLFAADSPPWPPTLPPYCPRARSCVPC